MGDGIQAWIQTLLEASGGRFKIDYYGDQALGKQAEIYDIIIDGTADIGQTSMGPYTGRFPLAQVYALPMIIPDANVGSQALQTLVDTVPEVNKEFFETVPLYFHVVGTRHLITASRPVHTVADMKGMKLRVTDAVSADVVKLLGAVPVNMDPYETYSSIERGILDGVLFEWGAVHAFKIAEVAKYATILGISTSGQGIWANPDSFNKLPADLKKILMDVSGPAGAKQAGKFLEDGEVTYREESVNMGMQVINPTKVERQRFVDAVTPLWDIWANDLESKGMPGKAILQQWLDIVSQTIEANKGSSPVLP